MCVIKKYLIGCYTVLFILVMIAFNKGAYLTYKSIFNKALTLF